MILHVLYQNADEKT